MATASSPSDDLLSREDAAAYLGISKRTLEIWHSTGRYKLPCVEIGGKIRRYRRAALEAWVEEQDRLTKEKKAKPRAARPSKREGANA